MKLFHGDILCFGPVSKIENGVTIYNDAIYQFKSQDPKYLCLCNNFVCTVDDANDLIAFYKTIQSDNIALYEACLNIELKTFQKPRSDGGSPEFVTIAGRRRKIIVQKRKRYVRYNSELILLSRLEKEFRNKNKGI
jgi:hypothetical protein